MKYGCIILIFLALVIFIAKNKSSKIISEFGYSGTLVAIVITKDKIFALSDGRIIYSRNNTITSDSVSKLHGLTDKACMLTLGRYIHKLTPEIIKLCDDTKAFYVEDVVTKTKLVAEELWQEYSLKHSNNQTNNIRDIRFFLFVVGFDRNSNPRLYYLDNMTSPAFKIQERVLFNAEQNVEIASMSTGSGETENPGRMISDYINDEINVKKRTNLMRVIWESFNKTKKILSKRNDHIGGKTFIATIDPNDGYKDNINIK